jgi:hypothetical protein
LARTSSTQKEYRLANPNSNHRPEKLPRYLFVAMISAPPRPVSVNSLARAPAQLPLPSKTARSTSAEIPFRDSHSLPVVEIDTCVPAPVPTSSGLGREETQFANLPIEIHENILDHIFGERAAASANTKSSAQNWSKAFRHPRRKALSNLALICRVWTPLVQSRIYRHSM